jgi:nucleoside triphosphate diphosphatase
MTSLAIDELLAVMARLRDPVHGCPWDLKQDFASIAVYTLEEAHEVVDAIERADWLDVQEELGDLLLQVVFHAQLAQERGLFDFAAVTRGITEKLIRRHPHVFANTAGGTTQTLSVERVAESWEQIKASEKAAKQQAKQATQSATGAPQSSAPHASDSVAIASETQHLASVLDDVPLGLPALSRTQKLASRAAKIGFDWPDWQGARAKVAEELAELDEAIGQNEPARIRHELGDLIQACGNLARKLDLDAEQCLRAANTRFSQRFRGLERSLDGQMDLPLAELERRWQQVKASE